MSVRARILFAVVAMASFACGARPAQSGNVSASPPLYVPPPAPTTPTIDEVSRARGLPLGTHVAVETLDHEAFVRALRKQEQASDWRAHFADLFLSTLSMAKPSSGAGAAAQRRYDEDVAGYYDPGTKKLYLRRDAIQKPSMTALTLAHEEEHALQDRFFGIPDFAKLGSADEMLAVKALIEGDATLTSTMMELARAGTTDATSVAVFARLDEADYAKAMHETSKEQVPALARATTNWPYQRGASFTAQLAESGGWDLVNAALRDPPKSTEQVLHVEKYVAGELPIDVRGPEAPEGYLSVERGRMGELQTRYFLAECVSMRDASLASSGWGGDAFLIATQGSQSALLWSTAWDDEAAAIRFAGALDARTSCGADEKPPFVAIRQGTRVAYMQGLDDDATRTREARKLLALVGHASPSLPPFGAVTLKLHPPIPGDFAHRGHLSKGTFAVPAIALESDLGPMKPLKDDSYELLATNGDARVSVAVRWSPPSTQLRAAYLETLAEALRKGYQATRIFDLGTSRVDVAATTLDASTIRADDKRDVRLALLPVCGGQITIALITSWKSGSAVDMAATDTWMKSVRVSDASPACDAVKTLRDPYGSR